MWGFHDRLLTLREALHNTLTKGEYRHALFRYGIRKVLIPKTIRDRTDAHEHNFQTMEMEADELKRSCWTVVHGSRMVVGMAKYSGHGLPCDQKPDYLLSEPRRGAAATLTYLSVADFRHLNHLSLSFRFTF
jgi:hypothetical protein